MPLGTTERTRKILQQQQQAVQGGFCLLFYLLIWYKTECIDYFAECLFNNINTNSILQFEFLLGNFFAKWHKDTSFAFDRGSTDLGKFWCIFSDHDP